MRQAAVKRLAILVLVAGAAVAGFLVLREGDQRGGGPGREAPPDFYGVNAPILRDYAAAGDFTGLDALAETMAAEGIDWARVIFDHSVEQRVPGRVDWSIPDAVVGALARHGVRTEALFVGTAGWAADPAVFSACGSRAEPGDIAGWSRFVGASVERYGRGGSFWTENQGSPALPIRVWEIGNEENLGSFWCPGANPERYAVVYRATQDAAISADRKAEVLVGGLAAKFVGGPQGDMAAGEFLERLTAADRSLVKRIPGVAVHAYAEQPAGVLQVVSFFRAAMRRAGLGSTPMIVNEVGWYTSGPDGYRRASESDRAERIKELAEAMPNSDCGIEAFAVHAWVTKEEDPDDSESWYGIADPASGDARESGQAYGEGIAAVRSGNYEVPIHAEGCD